MYKQLWSYHLIIYFTLQFFFCYFNKFIYSFSLSILFSFNYLLYNSYHISIKLEMYHSLVGFPIFNFCLNFIIFVRISLFPFRFPHHWFFFRRFYLFHESFLIYVPHKLEKGTSQLFFIWILFSFYISKI
jgi:hypothetical protein